MHKISMMLYTRRYVLYHAWHTCMRGNYSKDLVCVLYSYESCMQHNILLHGILNVYLMDFAKVC